jgi:hypothetical protein
VVTLQVGGVVVMKLDLKVIKSVLFVGVFVLLIQLCGCSVNVSAVPLTTTQSVSEVDDTDRTAIEDNRIPRISPAVELATAYTYPLENGIILAIDPRAELLHLASEFLYHEPIHYDETVSYLRESKEIFKEHLEDDFFERIQVFLDAGMKYGTWTFVLNLFNSENKIKETIDLSGISLDHRQNIDVMTNLMWSMKKFREKSAFDDFFVANEIFYTMHLKQAAQRIEQAKVSERIEDFFGLPIENVTVYFTPYRSHGYSATHLLKDGNFETLITMHAYSDVQLFSNIMIHEIAHRFLHIEWRRYPGLIEQSEWRYKPFESALLNEFYSNWERVFDETMVRAITCLVIGEIYGEDEMKKLIDEELAEGFSLIEDALLILEDYIKNRALYPTFSEFTYVLMEGFSVKQ